MELKQSLTQRLSHQQLQSIELLQLSALELDAYIRELTMENPMVEPEELSSTPERVPEDDLLGKLRWLEDNDYQNRFYQQMGEEELDPMARVSSDGGLEETLFRFLSRQIQRLSLDEDTAQIVRYLSACLDDSGYFRIPLEELSENSGISAARLSEGLRILRSLEPAGVGAESLSQCLELQLRRIQKTGPVLEIVRNYLDLLAKRHYRNIADKLSISVDEVLAAETLIRELEPRPGNVFQRSEEVPYILPDVFVEEEDGRFVARTRQKERPPFRINKYYRSLLEQSEDKEVKDYLTSKLHQAEGVLWAIGQRESTLQRCAQAIVDNQAEFFRHGPQALQPLRMSDVAQALEVHESTISRTVREKYLQCAKGVYPLSYFFSRSCFSANDSGMLLGGTAARALLRALIEKEDKAHPLSDQKLCELMAQENCPISRRTVAKYRDEMNIPGASGRKKR